MPCEPTPVEIATLDVGSDAQSFLDDARGTQEDLSVAGDEIETTDSVRFGAPERPRGTGKDRGTGDTALDGKQAGIGCVCEFEPVPPARRSETRTQQSTRS